MKLRRRKYLSESTHFDLIKVLSVDPNKTRKDNSEFALGGHAFVYDNIPKDEVWLEDGLKGKDRTAVLCHELIERTLMKFSGLTYEVAHKIADECEQKIRASLDKKKGSR